MANYSGSCLCGDVTFTIDKDPYFAGHCHCRDCQQASGAGHTSVGALPTDATKVNGKISKFQSLSDTANPVVREFCPRCGSRLFSHPEPTGPHVFVSLSALDDSSAIKPGAHIYLQSHQPWDIRDEKLPGF